MAGDAQAAGVGNALSVEEEEVGLRLQPAKGLEDGRPFAEAEQAGHVGKGGGQAGDDVFVALQIGKAEDGDGRAGHRVTVFEAHVDAGHVAHLAYVVAAHDGRRQPFLDGDRFGRFHVPVVLQVFVDHHYLSLSLRSSPVPL